MYSFCGTLVVSPVSVVPELKVVLLESVLLSLPVGLEVRILPQVGDQVRQDIQVVVQRPVLQTLEVALACHVCLQSPPLRAVLAPADPCKCESVSHL